MKWRKPSFEVNLTEKDVKLMEEKITIDGAEIHDALHSWLLFVETDWLSWDLGEYLHDIQCRYHLEQVLACVTEKTRLTLKNQIDEIDEMFKAEARTNKYPDYIKRIGHDSEEKYFWELLTLHPKLYRY